MKRLLDKCRKQDAVYWPPSSERFDEYGRPIVSDPVQLKVRWEDKAEEFIDAQGTKQVSSAKVIVGEDLEIGGLLMLGTLSDVDSSFPEDPKSKFEVKEIRMFEKIPDLKAKRYLRTAIL